MKILVTGANGFVARNLYPILAAAGYQIYALVHKHKDAIPNYVQSLHLDDLDKYIFDAVINLAGANIASKRWTTQRQQELFDSRVKFTHMLFNQLKQRPKVLLNASAVGFYGFDEDKIFTEQSTPNTGFTHDLCAAWENEAERFENDGVRTVIFRLGVVLGDGGALAKMKWAYLFGMGGKISTGKQFFPWIHIHDVCRFLLTALKDERYQGKYNLVAPHIVTQAEFATCYGQALNRPTLFTTPAFILKAVFGEMSDLLIQGQNVAPKALLDMNFEFEYAHLDAALKSLTK